MQVFTWYQTEQVWPRWKHALGDHSLHMFGLTDAVFRCYDIRLAEVTWIIVFIDVYALQSFRQWEIYFIEMTCTIIISSTTVCTPVFPAAGGLFHWNDLYYNYIVDNCMYSSLFSSGRFISLKWLVSASASVCVPAVAAAKAVFYYMRVDRRSQSVQTLPHTVAFPLTHSHGPIKSLCWSWLGSYGGRLDVAANEAS